MKFFETPGVLSEELRNDKDRGTIPFCCRCKIRSRFYGLRGVVGETRGFQQLNARNLEGRFPDDACFEDRGYMWPDNGGVFQTLSSNTAKRNANPNVSLP